MALGGETCRRGAGYRSGFRVLAPSECPVPPGVSPALAGCLLGVLARGRPGPPPSTGRASTVDPKRLLARRHPADPHPYNRDRTVVADEELRRSGPEAVGSRYAPLAVALALCVAAVVFCLPTLRNLLDAWSGHQYHGHVAVMSLIALGLVYSRRECISRALREARSPNFGFLLVLAAAAFQGVMYLGDLRWPAGIGICVLLAAIAYAVGGGSLLRPLAAPLACFALMIPPGFLLNPACGYAVRPLVSNLAEVWLQASGAAVSVEGHHLQLPGHRLVLVPSCCGLPPMLSLLVIAGLVAVSRLHGVLRRFALVASVVPLVVGVNVVRVVVAARLVAVIGQRDAQKLLAAEFSVPTLVAGLLLIAGLSRVLRRKTARDPEAS